MIKKLKINNFQSLKNIELDFDLGINVIIGETDTGKSAVVRALKALCFNTDNMDFLNYESKEYSIEGIFDNCTVKLEKPKNKYTLNNDDEFSSVGRNNVPDKISDLINIKEIDFDVFKKALNFSDQRDNNFLIEPGQKTAKVLGKITNINSILLAIKLVNLDKSRNNSSLKNELKIKEEKEKKIKEYKKIDEEKDRVDQLTQQYNIVDKTREKLDSIKELILNFNKCNDYERRINILISKYKELSKFSDDTEKLNQFNIKLIDIKYHFEKLSCTNKLIKDLDNSIQKYNLLDNISALVKKIADDFGKFKIIKNYVNDFIKIKENEYNINSDIKNAEDNIRNFKNNYLNYVNSLELCPIIKDVYKNGCLERLRQDD